jgi:hypothetical protein
MPGSIVASEKPDFIITSAGKKTGVEITRAVSQEFVRAQKLHAFKCPDSWINLTHLEDREKRRSNEEIFASITDCSSPWKKTEESTLEWKNKIAKALRLKRAKYNRPDYQVFDENWLLIHDDPPLPALDEMRDRAWRNLEALFLEPANVVRDFDTMFVHSGQYLFRWREQELLLANTELVWSLR